jgi:hypothetical protein
MKWSSSGLLIGATFQCHQVQLPQQLLTVHGRSLINFPFCSILLLFQLRKDHKSRSSSCVTIRLGWGVCPMTTCVTHHAEKICLIVMSTSLVSPKSYLPVISTREGLFYSKMDEWSTRDYAHQSFFCPDLSVLNNSNNINR